MECNMVMNRPASWWGNNWREATPLGNGYHGAMVYGAAANERIMLTHARLWRHGKYGTLPDVSDKLAEMRALIENGEIEKADRIIADALLERGNVQRQPVPVPAADLNIYIKPESGFSGYKRELSMNTAESVVSWRDGEIRRQTKSFVSRADDVVVAETDIGAKISICRHKSDDIGEHEKYPGNVASAQEGEWLFFKAETDGKEHGVAARVAKSGGKTLVIAKVFCEGDHKDKWRELKSQIETLPCDYNALFARHKPLHRELFERCEFDLEDEIYGPEANNRQLLDGAYENRLPNALAQRMWAYGRYLFVCSSDEKSLPCSLTSLFSGDYNAFWAINMANINLEMIYWQALPGMLPEYMLAVFDYYESEMETLRDCAKKLYGCRGIYLSAVSAPTSLGACCPAPHIINWTGGAGWIAQLYYDYWLYTRDLDFLEKRAMPFLREAGLFYEDFIVWESGSWHVYPSVSPENHTANYKGTGHEFPDGVQTAIDAAMDVAIIKEVFSHLIELGKITGAGESEIKKWQKILEACPAYKYNEDGSPREWLSDDFPDNELHRHQSHLYPAFPGLELARAGKAIAEKYRQGGLKRLKLGLSHQTSWSYAQNANLLARCGDGENAYKCLDLMAKSAICENLFTVHNDWRDMGLTLTMPSAPFQIDANMGWTAAVQEMLLYSDKDRIDLLPALPKQWEKGSIGPLNTRCGANVKLAWDQRAKTAKAELTAVYGTAFELYLPNGEKRKLALRKNEKYTVDISL
ncbi:MAG: glycoside hydrolase family 95 protein [Oscillospiraceae bacterium]|nr:glycoside hydrolase family 95 protein [Oscillospiraceae bacterium]